MACCYDCADLPNETHNDGHNAEGHEDTVGHISQVDGKSPKLRVVYQHKEQDQANQGSHQ